MTSDEVRRRAGRERRLAIRLAIYCAEDGQPRPHTPDDCTALTCDNIIRPHQTDVCRATTSLMVAFGTPPSLQVARSWLAPPEGDIPSRGHRALPSLPNGVPRFRDCKDLEVAHSYGAVGPSVSVRSKAGVEGGEGGVRAIADP